MPGADPGFQVRGAHLKKLRRAEGGAKFFWVFRVKNHDFTPKNQIFSNSRGEGAPPGSTPWCYFSYDQTKNERLNYYKPNYDKMRKELDIDWEKELGDIKSNRNVE